LAIKYLVTVPKYRIQATDIARKEGIPLGSKDKKRKDRKNLSKDELKREEDEAIRKIIEEKMDIR
jgi:DnaJ family protein C protein 25